MNSGFPGEPLTSESATPLHPTLATVFFAGTDTDVGKTYVTSLVAKWLRAAGKRVGVYKPVASGCRDDRIADDAVKLWQAAGRPRTLQEVCPQRFLAPLAPPAAAAAESSLVDATLLRNGADCWIGDCEVLLVEGAGGLLSPLADGVLNIDLAMQFPDVQLVIVAANRLGAIHQTLATVEASLHRGLTPAGIILCDPLSNTHPSADSNAEQIARYTAVPIIAEVPFAASEIRWK